MEAKIKKKVKGVKTLNYTARPYIMRDKLLMCTHQMNCGNSIRWPAAVVGDKTNG